ncbi:hypothetical protein FH869_07745 [Providencia rettgeri]|uniref:hypothetical protein n=1 Tax=Providencia rettgeri TaxID=587 RepID=UPI00111EFD93|nr:hypothetical protein FH869_07745 [Providencia rettgeri]
MNHIQKIAYISSRYLVASVWYDTSDLPKCKRLFAKAKELIAGDRAQIICQQEIDKEQQEI